MKVEKTNRCEICGYRDGSRVAIKKHVMKHTTKEKLDALVESVPISEREA